MPSHYLTKKNIFLSGIVIGIFVCLCPVQAGSAEEGEQKPAFFAGAAIAALRLDRTVPDSLTGWTASAFPLKNMHLTGRKLSGSPQVPELEPIETYGSFFGLRITLQLKGGWNAFSGGDIEKGFAGMYDSAVSLISNSGVPITQNKKEPNHSGLESGGDLIYCLTPRFGIGVGASRIKAGKESVLIYEVRSPDYDSLRTRPEINVSVLRLGMFYTIPFASRLAISIHGGPALYFAEYSFNMAVTSGGYGLDAVLLGFLPTGLYQKSSARQMGLEGGVGFDFNANPYVAFFVEVQGRYARISGFEGEEEAVHYVNYRPVPLAKSGSVYYVHTYEYPWLDVVPPEGTVGDAARKATLDFSGFSFSAGLKLRF